ncbi:exonuclease domain-containing protein [Bacillus sp. SCS-151]|uniref:exonuclease domain-containing protein n=1 Tax=Nanhaiella sioensis TaxID=3115293 RepID=UPI0039791DB1
MHYIVIDLEYTRGNKRKNIQNEIIQFGAVKSSTPSNLARVKFFSKHFKPNAYIPKRISELTGISNKTIKSAPSLGQVLYGFRNWNFSKDFIMVSWGENDLRILIENCYTYAIHVKGLKGHLNIQEVVMDVLQLTHAPSLTKAIELLGLTFVKEQHNALNDAYNTYILMSHLSQIVDVKKYIDHKPILNPLIKKNKNGSYVLSKFGKKVIDNMMISVKYSGYDDEFFESDSFFQLQKKTRIDTRTVKVIRKYISSFVNQA